MKRVPLSMTIVRWILGIVFIGYGVLKLAQLQFPHDEFTFNSETGHPITLFWYFFGYSHVYGTFIGLGETVAGLLLLIPRWATVGAIALLPISVNITVLDFSFDFPAVKYFVLVLTLLNIWLLYMERDKLMLLVDRKS